MTSQRSPKTLASLVARARAKGPVRVAVADAAQEVVLATMRRAMQEGLAEPHLVGPWADIEPLAAAAGLGLDAACLHDSGADADAACLHDSGADADAARVAVRLVRDGKADVVMKGNLHTDVFMRVLLDADTGLRVADCSAEGFAQAMTISVHSLIRMARHAEPLMAEGGSLVTLSYLGAERVVENYNVMGPVKAALESTVRYLSHELGPGGIRVNAISAGPVKTRAASGLTDFDALLSASAGVSPLRRNITGDEVGRAALLLASDYTAAITGETLHVDAGVHIEGPVGRGQMQGETEPREQEK